MEISHSLWPWHRSDATVLAGYANMMIMISALQSKPDVFVRPAVYIDVDLIQLLQHIKTLSNFTEDCVLPIKVVDVWCKCDEKLQNTINHTSAS